MALIRKMRIYLSRIFYSNGSEYLSDDRRYRRYKIGRYTYGRPKILNWNGNDAQLVIGNFCSIAIGVKIILGGAHRLDWISTYPFPAHFKCSGEGFNYAPIGRATEIGSDVWIGMDAVILSGVHVGHGAVVAACAVVKKDVPPYAIVAGNPARVIRYRFEENDVEVLLGVAWWDWPTEKIMKNLGVLMGSDIDAIKRIAHVP